MPGIDGIELMRSLVGKKLSAKVLLISGFGSRVLATAQRLGETRGLNMLGVPTKPFAVADLAKTLEQSV